MKYNFKDKYLKKSWVDFDEIFRKCPKWDKEQVIRFWERLGSSGSRLPDVFMYKINQKLGRILMKFSGYAEKVKG